MPWYLKKSVTFAMLRAVISTIKKSTSFRHNTDIQQLYVTNSSKYKIIINMNIHFDILIAGFP